MIPREVIADNYRILLRGFETETSIGRAVLNTGIVVLYAVVLMVLVCFPAGYAFAVYEFRYKKALFWSLMITFAVGRYQTIIPHFILISRAGLTNTHLGAALPMAFSPLTIFFFRNYMQAIPSSIIDSARIDGAGDAVILWRVIVPLCGPVVGVMVLFKGLEAMSDFLWPLLVMQYPWMRTLYVEIFSRISNVARLQQSLAPIGVMLAGGVVLLIPMLCVFIATGRRMIEGLNTGGLKE